MIRHVAVYTWKPGTTDAEVAAFLDAVRSLAAQIPEVRSLTIGPDLGLADGNDASALVGEFDDADSYARYASHPVHQDVIERLAKPIIATRHAVQFEVADQ